ncbi:MAG TPA: cyanophycinase [Roseateles sp.]|nr:cyanophycinase [Roseateles sp.]
MHLAYLVAVLLWSVLWLRPLEASAQTAIAIGGALRFDHQAVWRRIVDEAGGPGARFAVFATAAGNPARAAERVIEALRAQGADATLVPVAPALPGVNLQQELHRAENLALVRRADGVFFTGGAQALIVDTLQPDGRPTELLQAIWALYRRGGVIAGTSAGAAVLSTTMFRDAPDALQALRGGLREGREIDRGLGFVGPALLIDQHFLRRGRIGRLLPLMQAKGYRVGLGVEENSAVVIKGSMLEVIGGKGALLVDLGQARHDPGMAQFNVRGALLSFLAPGDRHDLATGHSLPAARKLAGRRLLLEEAGPDPVRPPVVADILADNAIVAAMSSLLESPAREAYGLAGAGISPPGFEFRLYKTAATTAWQAEDADGDYTMLRLGLDVRPLQGTAAP